MRHQDIGIVCLPHDPAYWLVDKLLHVGVICLQIAWRRSNLVAGRHDSRHYRFSFKSYLLKDTFLSVVMFQTGLGAGDLIPTARDSCTHMGM